MAKPKFDFVVITADVLIEHEDGSLVFIKRKNPPFKGQWAIPGGLMDAGELIEETAVREAEEETGLKVKLTNFIGVYADPGRDPRGRYISFAFVAKPVGGELKAASDAAEILLSKDYANMELAFDHNKIINDYLKKK